MGQEDPLDKGMAIHSSILRASQVALVVKNPPGGTGDIRDVGSTILDARPRMLAPALRNV